MGKSKITVGASAVNQTHQSDVLLRSAFGIALKPTTSMSVHGAFPKIDWWSSRTCIRERTLRLFQQTL